MPEVTMTFAERSDAGAHEVHYDLLEIMRYIYVLVEVMNADDGPTNMLADYRDFGDGLEACVTEEGGRYIRDMIPALRSDVTPVVMASRLFGVREKRVENGL